MLSDKLSSYPYGVPVRDVAEVVRNKFCPPSTRGIVGLIKQRVNAVVASVETTYSALRDFGVKAHRNLHTKFII